LKNELSTLFDSLNKQKIKIFIFWAMVTTQNSCRLVAFFEKKKNRTTIAKDEVNKKKKKNNVVS
jgi:hypothetical protein